MTTRRRNIADEDTFAFYEGGPWHGKLEEMQGTPQQGFPDSWPAQIVFRGRGSERHRYDLTLERRVIDRLPIDAFTFSPPTREPRWVRVYQHVTLRP